MARFRKKPVVVEAVQYLGDASNAEEMLTHLEGCVGWHMTDGGMVIPTLEGSMLAQSGDWIIKGIKGEFYPCRPDIFASTYEVVD